MFSTSVIEISRSALEANLTFVRNLLPEHTRHSSVVKGNAYGHSIELFVPLAEDCGVDHFSVFEADEARRVMEASEGNPDIMIMGDIENAELEWAIQNGIEFYVFEPDRLEAALRWAKKLEKKAKIHLEVETGMYRTGLEAEEMEPAFKLMQENPDHLDFTGLCTHYAGAESIANYYRIKKQRVEFRRIRKQVEKMDLKPRNTHTSCSAAMLRYPENNMDLARIGILQYGFFPSRETLVEYVSQMEHPADPLRRLITWKSRVMDIKSVPMNSYIGYGTSYLANKDMIIASVPIGYGHGYGRRMSNQGRVLIRGNRTSVVGMVNMNMMMVDVTDIDGVEKGDEVVLIGHQGDMEISVSAFGEFSHQVNYELLTRLPLHIPRRVVD